MRNEYLANDALALRAQSVNAERADIAKRLGQRRPAAAAKASWVRRVFNLLGI